ncbi:MAG: hypothetical protein ACREYD_12590 [Casimicrobiaceae bacterium]
MTKYAYQFLLGASLALFVGAAGAQNTSDSNSLMRADKGTTHAMPAQPSPQPSDKMSADPNAASQPTETQQSTAEPAKTAPMRHAHGMAMHHREAVSPDERTYRQALRQCAKERDESQRDSCLDNAIEQHQPNS